MLGWLLEFLNTFWNALYNVVTWLLDGVITVVFLVINLLWDGFLTIVYLFISGLDFGSLIVSTSAAWGLIDSNTAWVVSATGIPQGLTILGYAYIVRLTLNLIPSWLTRV